MQRRKYLVVTDAKREKLIEPDYLDKFSPYFMKPHIEQVNYRFGDLGMLHPEVVKFYSDLRNNLNKSAAKELNIFERGVPLTTHTYLDMQHPDDLPVVFYEGNSYSLSALRKDEFSFIEGVSVESVWKGLKEIYKKKGISYNVSSNGLTKMQTLESGVRETWKHLECFKFLALDALHKIPMDDIRREIPKEDLEKALERFKNKDSQSSLENISSFTS